MLFLTDNQRSKALELLATAPDEIILSAMVDLRKHRHVEQGTRANFDQVVEELNAASTGTPPPSASSPASPVDAAPLTPRKNKTPGVPTTTKIGSVAKEYILEALGMGVQPGPKYSEHLKLLWSRGEVKYDGVEFYT